MSEKQEQNPYPYNEGKFDRKSYSIRRFFVAYTPQPVAVQPVQYYSAPVSYLYI